MSHHNSIQGRAPKKVSFLQNHQDEGSRNIPAPLNGELLIAGQGCLTFQVPFAHKEVSITFSKAKIGDGEELILKITEEGACFYYEKDRESTHEKIKFINDKNEAYVTPADEYVLGIDEDKTCVYWVSIDSLNKRLRYGKGEMRLSTALLDFQYDEPRNLFTPDDAKERYSFIDKLKDITVSNGVKLVSAWKDPMVSEPPAYVLPSSKFTMDLAAGDKYTTASSLSPECQILYGNVADFELNTPDFPDFEQAIEYSIRTEGCIGHKIIKYKLEHNQFGPGEASDYQEVYLRITLGHAQGESPGIPYVMEIWPVGCASPVHNHGFTHAIIKVLRGEIDVDLYRMLPTKDNLDKSLKTVSFNRNEVTYLMPEVNQFHKLKNNLENSETCITIQCYSYSKDDDIHHSTFDYIETEEVEHFDPVSDCDFLDFKAQVKAEWTEYLNKRFWSGEKA